MRFREELLEALAMALLDQQEVESAEMELNQLRRYCDIVHFEHAVTALESEYYSELRQHPTAVLMDCDALPDMESRLILARLLLSVETISAALLAARHRHGDSSTEVQQLAVSLEQHVQLLSSSTDQQPCLHLLMDHERRMGLHRINPALHPPNVLPPHLADVYHQLRNRPALLRGIGGASTLQYRVKCQEMKVTFLKMRNAGKMEVAVRRDVMLAESRALLMQSPQSHLRRRLFVKYQGEDGNDFGGLTREWLYLLSQRAVQAAVEAGRLSSCANDVSCLQIAPCFKPTMEVLADFEFMGRIAGLALFHGKVIDFNFVSPFYKALLGCPLVLSDLAAIDEGYHRSLLHVLEAPHSDQLMLTFAVDYMDAGASRTHELLPDGESKSVDDHNKGQYVDLMVKWLLSQSISRQMDAFRRGVGFVVDVDFLRQFSPDELAQLTQGLGKIDLNDWRANTAYENGYTSESPAVVWFWEAMASFAPQKQCLVLKFVTGASRPPAQGFAGLSGTHGTSSFCVYRNDAVESLPVGHTCINRLDLPAYSSLDLLVAKLTMAVEETEGFGII